MKVTFVFADLNVFQDCSRDYSGIFAHGIGYLSSALKREGHLTSLIHLVKPIGQAEFIRRVGTEKPGLVAFSSFSHQFEYVKQLAAWLKESHRIPVICGGVHATIDPEEVIKVEAIDMLCRGEGEQPLVELCHKLERGQDISGIRNVWLKQDGKIIRNQIRPLDENIDRLPFPDRTLFNYRALYDYKIRMLTVLASRGCPYNCSYCCNHQYQKLYPHNYVRFRSVDNVLAEIEEALSWYPDIEFVNFIDDTLCIRWQWLEEFARKFPKKFNFPFHGNSRINLLDEEMMALLKKARCERLDVGIEAGNSYIRERILNRKISDEQIRKVFELGRKFNIKLAAYNMIGCPFETPATILETIRLNAQVKPYSAHNAIFQPYPNTDIYRVCIEEGFISEKKVSAFFKESVLDQPRLSKRQVTFFSRYFMIIMKFYRFFYKLPQGISTKLSSILDKSWVSLSKSYIALKLYFLARLIFSPIRTTKLLVMRINPGLARKFKYLIYGRYYMKGRKVKL